MSRQSSDAVVVGAGIVGTACARALARENFRVTIVESEAVGGGATAQGMGHIVVMDDSEAQFALSRYSQTLWDEIAPDLPSDCEHETCGTIWVATDDEEMQAVQEKRANYNRHDVGAEVLGAKALAEAEPNLRPSLAGGLLVPGDSVVFPPGAARWLVATSPRPIDLLLGKAAVEISDEGVRLTDGSILSTAVIVNAAGIRAAQLVPGLRIQPRKGHLLITDRYPGFANHQLIELGYLKSAGSLTTDSVAMNVQPRNTGQLLIGSSRQYGVETSEIDQKILARMVDRAIEYMPRLAGIQAIRTWTGLRAATPDKLPLIGPCPGFERVYLAAVHEGLGITTAMGTAELLVDLVLGRKSRIPREPYLPSRFENGQAGK